MPTPLEGRINTYVLQGGVSTAATLASTSADAGADTDSRNENIRNINNLVLDVAELNRQVSDLIAILRSNQLIFRP